MSSLAKLKVTLAVMASKLRQKRRPADVSSPGPHSRRWDERERAESLRSRHGGLPVRRSPSTRDLVVLGSGFAASVAAELLLPPTEGTVAGLAIVGATLAYLLHLRRSRAPYSRV